MYREVLIILFSRRTLSHLRSASLLALSSIVLAACGQGTIVPPQLRSAQAPTSFNRLATPNTVRGLAASANYYDGAQGLQGEALLGTLAQIVSKHQDLGYDTGRDIMFGEVDDSDNDDVVSCVYTNRQVARVKNAGDAYSQNINTEHTWPKSKGASGGPAKADLHHLFPSDVNTNSARSSFPFGKVVKVQKSFAGSKLGTDAQGRTVFEPQDSHKGNVARALFYFYTVYGRKASLANFKVEEPVMQEWHRMDPVDAAEQERNDAIFKHQHNRNPYIDHPEYVTAIGSFLNPRR